MKLTKNTLVALALVTASACSSGIDFRIDNPTSRELTVTVDDKPYAVAGGADTPLTLAPGVHALSSEATGPVRFIVRPKTRGGLINPTLAQYVVVTEVYAVDRAAMKHFARLGNTISVDGVQVRGPYTTSRELFIDQTWKFGAHEDFPQTITVTSDSKGNIQGKLFTAGDFVRYYTQNGGPEFTEHERTPEPVVRPTKDLPPLPDFKDAEMQAASKELRDVYASALQPGDGSSNERYQKGTIALLNVYANKAVNMPVEENKKYNFIIEQVGNTLGHSAMVIE